MPFSCAFFALPLDSDRCHTYYGNSSTRYSPTHNEVLTMTHTEDTMTQPTCEERVQSHLASRMDDLRNMWRAYTGEHAYHIESSQGVDFGLFWADDEDEALDMYAEEAGYDDFEDLLDNVPGSSREDVQVTEGDEWTADSLYEYGLSFDYVMPGTFEDQDEGYFRYQLSYGGPSDEFRFFTSGPRHDVHRIEYYFMDWFDGASRRLHGDDYAFMSELFEQLFVETMTADAEYEKASEDY